MSFLDVIFDDCHSNGDIIGCNQTCLFPGNKPRYHATVICGKLLVSLSCHRRMNPIIPDHMNSLEQFG